MQRPARTRTSIGVAQIARAAASTIAVVARVNAAHAQSPRSPATSPTPTARRLRGPWPRLAKLDPSLRSCPSAEREHAPVVASRRRHRCRLPSCRRCVARTSTLVAGVDELLELRSRSRPRHASVSSEDRPRLPRDRDGCPDPAARRADRDSTSRIVSASQRIPGRRRLNALHSRPHDLHVLLRHRLLRQPGGFEGFGVGCRRPAARRSCRRGTSTDDADSRWSTRDAAAPCHVPTMVEQRARGLRASMNLVDLERRSRSKSRPMSAESLRSPRGPDRLRAAPGTARRR